MSYNLYTNGFSKDDINKILGIVTCKNIEKLKKSIYNFSEELIERSINEEISIRGMEDINVKDYYGELRDYQTIGSAFLYYSKRSILGDSVGMGKTVVMSSLINILKSKNELIRGIIIVESSALGQVQSELIRFTGLNVGLVEGDKTKLSRSIKKGIEKYDLIVSPHSILTSDLMSTLIAKHTENGVCSLFDLMILDESSIIKNEGTKIYTYTKNISRVMSRVHFLNATTFEIKMMEIVNQINILLPNFLPSKKEIEQNYCVFGRGREFYKKDMQGVVQKRYAWELKGYKNQAKFKEAISLIYLGRAKENKLEHRYKVVRVYPTHEQLVAMNNKYSYNEVLNSPVNIPEINFNREEIPKLDELLNIIESEEHKNKKTMIYCWNKAAHLKIKEELEKLGKKVEILNGKINNKPKERKRVVDRLNNEDLDVIVTNIKRSLNLWNAKLSIMYSLETNPGKMEQIRGRTDRSVDDIPCDYILMVYRNTPEEYKIIGVVKQRAKDARELTLDSDTAIDWFVDAYKEELEKERLEKLKEQESKVGSNKYVLVINEEKELEHKELEHKDADIGLIDI